MYDRELYSKVVRFQRTAVDNTFAIFTTLQGYGEEILKKSLEHNPWLPEKSKSTCVGLTDTCLHGSKTLRKFIDQGFDEMERLVAQSGMTQKRAKPETKSPPSRPAAATSQKQASEKKSAAAKSAAPQKSTTKSTSSELAASTVKAQKQSTATPTGVTPAATPAATSVATTAAAPAAKPAPTTKPAAPSVASPVAKSTAPPTATPEVAMTKPSELSEKTAKGGVTTAEKPT